MSEDFKLKDKVEVINGHYKGLRGYITGSSWRYDFLHKDDKKYLKENKIKGKDACGWTVKIPKGLYNDKMIPRCMIKLLTLEESKDIKIQGYTCPVCLTEGDIFDPPNGSVYHICYNNYDHIICGNCFDDYIKVKGKICPFCNEEYGNKNKKE